MVSRYVPDMGDLIWVDFDPTKGSEQAGHRQLLSWSFHVQQQWYVSVCSLYNAIKRISVRCLSGQERDGVALADQVKVRRAEEQRRKEQLPQGITTH